MVTKRVLSVLAVIAAIGAQAAMPTTAKAWWEWDMFYPPARCTCSPAYYPDVAPQPHPSSWRATARHSRSARLHR
jgi:hypothetical protein